MKPRIIELNYLQWIETDGKTSGNRTAVRSNMLEARPYMKNAPLDLLSIYKIREGIKTRLRENDLKIASLKMMMEKERNEMNLSHLKLIYALNQQNTKLKIRIYEYTEGTMEKWELFIVGYNQELDEVSKTLSELIERNLNKN